MRALCALLLRDLRLAVRHGGALGTALGFFLVMVVLTPLGLGPDLAMLNRIAPGVLWIGLLLSALLSLPRVLEPDFDDGSLEMLATGPVPLELVMAAKALVHWLTTALPLVVLAPLLGLLLNLELAAYPILLATMLLGTPAVSFLGLIGAGLSLGGRRSGLLIAVLVLPIYIPTLVFGIGAVTEIGQGGGATQASLMILAAVSLAAMVLGPVAAAASVRMQLS